MKRIYLALLALSFPLMTLTPLALAAALDTKIVSADALWVMHIDLNAVRGSTIGEELMAQAAIFQAQAMKEANLPVQIDVPKLLTTIGSITAYGTNFSQDPNLVDGALIFQGTADLRKIAEGFAAQATVTAPKQFTQLKDLPFEAYSIDGQLIVAFPPEPILLIGKSKTQLLAAQKIFRGEGASLAQAKTSPLNGLIRSQAGAFVLAASLVPSGDFFPDDAPQARILQMAKSASVGLGEQNKQTFAHVQLFASSEDSADKLMKILQGIAAMVSLAESSDQYLAEFLRSVAVTREKNIVTLHLAYASERLVQMARDFQKPKTQRPRRPQDNGAQRNVSNAPVPPVEGKVILKWKGDQQLGDLGVSLKTLVSRTVANIPLAPGQVIILTGHRNAGENARFDYVEIAPSAGGAAQRIEAESMKLDKYTVLKNQHTSDGKLIQAHDSHGTARFSFTGSAGNYTIAVRYVDETDGESDFFLSVKEPAAEKLPEKP
jgi:hypothetical protein